MGIIAQPRVEASRVRVAPRTGSEERYLQLIRQAVERLAGKKQAGAASIFSERLLEERAEKIQEAIFKKTGRRVAREDVLKAFYNKLLEIERENAGGKVRFMAKQPLMDQLFVETEQAVLRKVQARERTGISALVGLVISPFTGKLVLEDEVYVLSEEDAYKEREIIELASARKSGRAEDVVDGVRRVLAALSSQSGKALANSNYARYLVETADGQIISALIALRSKREWAVSGIAIEVLRGIAYSEEASAEIRADAFNALSKPGERPFSLSAVPTKIQDAA